MIHVYKNQPPDIDVYDVLVDDLHAVEERREWYAKYRKSPVWKAKRRAVLDRVKIASGLYRCESCGYSFPASEIEIHHLTYERVGREPLFDLAAVCNGCHGQLTEWGRE